MIRALLYLQWRSLVNRLRARFRRLKEPRYLAGAVVGLLYFFGLFLRPTMHGGLPEMDRGRWSPGSPEWVSGLELGGAFLLLLLLAALWILPSRRAALEFTEAEIQFLFPAPVSRRGLLHYKLVSGQIGLLFTSLVVSLLSGRLLRGDGAWMSILGCWLALLVIQLHALAASFVRSRLLDRGLSSWSRRIAVVGGMAVFLLALVTGLRGDRPPFPVPHEPEEVWAWVESVSRGQPIVWILEPLRWVVRLPLTRDPGAFAFALPPVAAVVVIHYFWVIHANVAFEEAADRRGDRRVRSGSHSRRTVRLLPPIRHPWLALAWKNLIAAGILTRSRWWAVILAVVVLAVPVLGGFGSGQVWTAAAASMASILLVVAVLFGPGAARFDLRQDLMRAGDLLKALPLPGWQIVMGSLLAPWGVLALVQWALALVAFALLPLESRLVGTGWGTRAILLVSTAMLAPSLTLVGLCIQNAAALFFPGWIQSSRDRGRGGFEMMGQQLIVFVGQMLVVLLAVIPAVIFGVLVFALLSWGLGPWGAAVPAAAAAAGVFIGEALVAVWLLGRFWERLDVVKELAP